MSAHPDRSWVRRTDVALSPDPTRVVARIFLPGQEMSAVGESRSTAVLDRVQSLSEVGVDEELAAVTASFAGRHRDLGDVWEANAALVEHRVVGDEPLSQSRRRLVGAYFTQEYAIEGAALFNPSMVEHPDQSGLDEGCVRFIMSVRAVGEGHVSSIELRTGIVHSDGTVSLDPAPTVAVLATAVESYWSKDSFRHQFRDMWGGHTNSDFVLDSLPEVFTRAELDASLQSLRDQRLTRGAAVRTMDQFDWIAACSYSVEFPEDSALQERVLMPRGPAESHGMEDARLVRIPLADGGWEYLGTYTAYDGGRISTQLFSTRDFRRFVISRLSGMGSRNKGLALFPRMIGGQYVALSRSDRESNGVTTSEDLQNWTAPTLMQTPQQPWELVQLGNCGPPVETDHGWLVLTHGVGPMRTYSIGALLLDLDDPTIVIGRLRHPLLTPEPHERSGYVPNVVYSCGAMLHDGTLVLPYGCSDSTSRVALVTLEPLLAELLSSPDVEAGPNHPETS